jgi:fatty-acyl-CoA synthase
MIGDLPDLIAKRAMLRGESVALEDAATGRTLTYAELDERAGRSASLMAARGIGAGDRVAILSRNRPEFFEILFACAKLGAILVPLNWRMPPAELEGLIADSGPSLLIHGAAEASAAAALAPLPRVDLDDGYEALLAAAPIRRWRALWPADGIWYLIYTSGTTGRPKGVIYTFRMAIANYVNIGGAIRLTGADRTLAFLPVFHTAGINLHALPTLIAGGRVVAMDGFDADRIITLVEARRLDTIFGVPTVYQGLLEHPRFAAAPLDGVRHWGCGGAPLPDAIALACRDLGIRLCAGMGMTETGPTAFLVDPADAWTRIGSVGRPQLLCSARVIGKDGREAAPGEVGELQFAGPGVTPGYWRNPEATAAAFTEDGWLVSGDLARREADGTFRIAGRRKEMFISGGENVYPAEVENVLSAHPAVADAAVLPETDPKWGEVGRAFIQLAQGGLRPAPDELKAFCRARLAPYKVPRRFDYVAEFPRTSAGKIQKHLLVEGR